MNMNVLANAKLQNIIIFQTIIKSDHAMKGEDTGFIRVFAFSLSLLLRFFRNRFQIKILGLLFYRLVGTTMKGTSLAFIIEPASDAA